ncbi:hypothetical protein Scep_027549 [Stephania cephalantha]|uniref:Uncharacterized protein n=1 Tax=Stephania cephalantha TaxID=152367 RepID=A0AAP0HKW5_9MAGN
MASDIVNFLSGRILDPTTTTTTTSTTTTTMVAATNIETDTSAPTQPGPRQSQHDSTSTNYTPSNAPPHRSMLSPPKRMLGKEYTRKKLKKPKQ